MHLSLLHLLCIVTWAFLIYFLLLLDHTVEWGSEEGLSKDHIFSNKKIGIWLSPRGNHNWEDDNALCTIFLTQFFEFTFLYLELTQFNRTISVLCGKMPWQIQTELNMHICTYQVQIFRDVQLTSKFNIKRLRFTEYLASSNIQEFTIDQKYMTLRLKIGQIFFCNFRAAGGRTGGICSK